MSDEGTTHYIAVDRRGLDEASGGITVETHEKDLRTGRVIQLIVPPDSIVPEFELPEPEAESEPEEPDPRFEKGTFLLVHEHAEVCNMGEHKSACLLGQADTEHEAMDLTTEMVEFIDWDLQDGRLLIIEIANVKAVRFKALIGEPE